MTKLKRIWQASAPNVVLVFIRFLTASKGYKSQRKAVLEYFNKLDYEILSPDMRECFQYLKFHKFSAYPFRWALKYDQMLPEVYLDVQHDCFYVLFEGEKMYFPKRFTETQVIWMVRSIKKKQDRHSPHLYLTHDFQVDADSIVVDAGATEGSFALSVVGKARKLFLVENDPEWLGSLRLTFAPWIEKVVFVEKLLSDTETETTTSIDSFLKPATGENYFIKLDTKGLEIKGLSGMKNLADSDNHIKITVCTHRNINDLVETETFLNDYGFKYHISDSFILYAEPGEEPSFRKALIRAERPQIVHSNLQS